MFGIGYVTKRITPCTRETFFAAIKSKTVSDICQLIVRLQETLQSTTDEKKRKWCEARISQAKKSLPCITPMAWFRDDVRKVANAVPSGLNMLDVDHIDLPRELWESVKDKAVHKVCLAHITPSAHGLRIIFVQPEGKDLGTAQTEMARSLGVDHDVVTKDYARCSFLVPEDYILYHDYDLLFSDLTAGNDNEPALDSKAENRETDGNDKIQDTAGEAASQQVDNSDVAVKSRTSYPDTFRGVPYSDIIEELLLHTGYDVTPSIGERNTALYVLARNIRYCCDFDTDFILSLLPDWGLPAGEVRNTVDSAVKSVRTTLMPKVLSRIIEQKQKMSLRDADFFANPFEGSIEEEGIIGEFVRIQPAYLKTAAYLTAMTCFGTLLTRLRGYGPDGAVIAPNFMLTVSAPQASGKSFMKRIATDILRPIEDEDNRQRKEMQRIERENKKNKDKDGYEAQEFEGVIRILPSNTSNRILLERMDKAKGQHCIIIAEEIDSITKAEKSGKWSEKSDIYRLAFDNSKWGQDYASENSYHAVVPLYLNLLFSGTPAAVSRFFNDIENGLITRFLFCDLPDNYGQKRPKLMFMSDEVRQHVSERVRHYWQLMQDTHTEDGLIWMDTAKMVEDVSVMYDEVQRMMYLLNQDDVSRDLARRRYATLAVQMMMVETYLNDGVYTESIRDRVIGIINFCTDQLIASYGEEINRSLNESVAKQFNAANKSQKQLALDALPDVFTNEEFADKIVEYNGSRSSAPVHLMRLVKGGVVTNIGRGVYKKL